MLQRFRISDFFNRAGVERPAERIERALLDRTRRLVIGVNVDEAFERISGVLVVAKGRGYATRVQFADGVVNRLPDALQKSCQSAVREDSRSVEFSNCASDLAEHQAEVVERLKIRASKYVDRILAVAVTDPGWWKSDFDGAIRYSSFCDTAKLAERTGISVVDGWPTRDLSVGGNGKALDPLAWWLLYADRNQRIARQVNSVIRIEKNTSVLMLPPSDGLDVDSAKLTDCEVEGVSLIQGLKRLSGSDSVSIESVRQLLVTGFHDPELIDQWRNIKSDAEHRTDSFLQVANSSEYRNLTTDQLLCTAMKWICDQCCRFVQKSLISMKANYADQKQRLLAQLEASPKLRVAKRGLLEAFDQSEPNFDSPGKIVVDAPEWIIDAIVSRVQNEFDTSSVAGVTDPSSGIAMPEDSCLEKEGLIAAMMGFLHVDQMPGNLPQFTGASQQRILGQLTPGRPNSWRNLLKEMADFEPPSIKLRDAV